MERNSLYRMIWRWHFYAALFVMPMVLILAATGGIYLFKPQVERWEERAYQGLSTDGAVTPSRQLHAVRQAFPGFTFKSYRLPEKQGDAALIEIASHQDGRLQDVFVSPQGKVLGALNPSWRVMQVVHDIHGELLIGKWGSWLVELAASWAIVMIVTGLYLWWPVSGGLGGVLWPRVRLRGRLWWRDLHAVTGFWVSALAMLLLLTALPWTGVWNGAFDALRAEMGWVKGDKGWSAAGSQSAMAGAHDMHDMGHHQADPRVSQNNSHFGLMLDRVVAHARSEHLAFPVIVSPLKLAGGPGLSPSSTWTARSDAQNRPLRETITYDGSTGVALSRATFKDKHAIDQVVAYGIAWHEGQLFGLANQVIGLGTALALLVLSVSGFVLWRRRKPEGLLGAPPQPAARSLSAGIIVIFALFFVLLPMFAISVILLWLFERLALPHMPRLGQWLGAADSNIVRA